MSCNMMAARDALPILNALFLFFLREKEKNGFKNAG